MGQQRPLVCLEWLGRSRHDLCFPSKSGRQKKQILFIASTTIAFFDAVTSVICAVPATALIVGVFCRCVCCNATACLACAARAEFCASLSLVGMCARCFLLLWDMVCVAGSLITLRCAWGFSYWRVSCPPCHAVARPLLRVLCRLVPCHVVPLRAVSFHGMPCGAPPVLAFRSLPCSAAVCCGVAWRALQCCAIPCRAVAWRS